MTHQDVLYQYCRRHNILPSQVVCCYMVVSRMGVGLATYWQHLN